MAARKLGKDNGVKIEKAEDGGGLAARRLEKATGDIRGCGKGRAVDTAEILWVLERPARRKVRYSLMWRFSGRETKACADTLLLLSRPPTPLLLLLIDAEWR